MRLTVLGGSAASPNTGAGCSGYLIQHGTTAVALDLGPGTLQELRRHTDFRALAAVVISHLHPDHTLDVFALQFSLAYNPLPAPLPVPVWLPPGGSELLARLTAAYGDLGEAPGFFSSRLQPQVYDPAVPLAIGSLTLEFAAGVHYIPSWAMRVSAARRSIGYTGDTGPSAALDAFFADVDLLLAEATLLDAPPGSEDIRGSLTAAEAGALATRSRAKRLLLTHLWEERGFASALAAARSTYAGPIDLARPGLRVSL